MTNKLMFMKFGVTDNIKLWQKFAERKLKKKGSVLPSGAYLGIVRTNYTVPLHFINAPGPEQRKHIINFENLHNS